MSEDAIVQTPFAIVPLWVADHGAHAILVYFALSSFRTYGGGECFPSVSKIAERAALSERSVRTALKKLRDAGAITVTVRERKNGSQTTNLYRLVIDEPKGAAPRAGSGLHEVQGQGRQDVQPQNESQLERDPSPEGDGRSRAPAREAIPGTEQQPTLVGTKMFGKPVAKWEMETGGGILRGFNRLAGKNLTPTRENMLLVIGRLRENPELSAADWDKVIEVALKEKWWSGPATLNVIFGPRAFPIARERALSADTSPGRVRAADRAARSQQNADDFAEAARRLREIGE